METPNTIPMGVTFKCRVRDESIGGENPYRWQDVTTDEIFKGSPRPYGRGKKVVLFALPGAFTPTCDAEHLPGYERLYQQFKDEGVDEVVCLSVNDAFVMNAWGRKLNAENVRLVPDGNAEFTRAMGMLVKKENLGFGERSWRYSALVEDGEIKQLFEEEGKRDNADDDPFEVSDANTMLEYLKSCG